MSVNDLLFPFLNTISKFIKKGMVWETKTCSHKRGGRIKRNIQIRKCWAFLRTIDVRAGGGRRPPRPVLEIVGIFRAGG